MRAYFENRDSRPFSVTFTTVVMAFFTLVFGIVAEQILTGWIPLGARININRQDLNTYEWLGAILCILLAIGFLRTTIGLLTHERASWLWAQWMAFISMLLGLALTLNPIFIGITRGWTTDLSPILSVWFFANLAVAAVVLIGYFWKGKGLTEETRRLVRLFLELELLNLTLFLIVLSFGIEIKNVVRRGDEYVLLGGDFSLLLICGLVLFWLARMVYTSTIQGSEYTPGQRLRINLADSPSAGGMVGLVVLLSFFSMTVPDKFLTTVSIGSFLTNNATAGIVAIGITILMISGEFDLSVGSILGVSAMIFLLFMGEGLGGIGFLSFGPQSVLAAAVLALLCASVMGLINGVLLVQSKIPSFIVTLGTQFIFRAIALKYIGGGRILRYRDYFPPPADFPQIFISRWLIAGLAIIGFLFVLYASARIVPLYFKNFQRNLQRIRKQWATHTNDNDDFGIVVVILSGLWLLISSLLFAVAIIWLALVAWYHLARVDLIDTIGTGDFWLAIFLGVAALALFGALFNLASLRKYLNVPEVSPSFYHNLSRSVSIWIVAVIAYAFVLNVYDISLDFNNADGALYLLIAGFTLVVLLILYLGYMKDRSIQQKSQSERKTRSVSFNRFVLKQGLILIVASIVFAGLVTYLASTAYDVFSRIDSPLQVGFFDVANGQWRFTLEEVTHDQLSVQIPESANLRNAIAWWIILAILFQIILVRTRYGNAVFAVGGNIGAARAQGINGQAIKVSNFVLVAFLTGIAAILEASRNPGVDPLKGNGQELDVITMTVIGGALLSGGYGSIIGTIMGVLIFGILQTGLVLIGVDSRIFKGFVGGALIFAVILNNFFKRSRS